MYLMGKKLRLTCSQDDCWLGLSELGLPELGLPEQQLTEIAKIVAGSNETKHDKQI
jgi:hypothetical protein